MRPRRAAALSSGSKNSFSPAAPFNALDFGPAAVQSLAGAEDAALHRKAAEVCQ